MRSLHDMKVRRAIEQLGGLVRVLQSFDPRATLRRGYAIVTAGGEVLKAPEQAPAGTNLMIQLAEGRLKARAEDESKN